MCLAVPAQVNKIISPDKVEVLLHQTTLTVSGVLQQDLQAGDFVLVHAGHIIEKISPQDAAALESSYQALWQALDEE